MQNKLIALLCALLLCAAFALADGQAAWSNVPQELRPGKLMQLTYSLPEYGFASITVLDAAGDTVLVLKESAATGRFVWDGEGLAPGDYILRLTCGDVTDDRSIHIGTKAPVLTVVEANDRLQDSWSAEVVCNMAGVLTVTLPDGTELFRQTVAEGDNELRWNGLVNGQEIPRGDYDFQLRLLDADGYASGAQAVEVTVSRPRRAHDAYDVTPDDMSGVTCEHDICYWKLPMGSLDEAAVWEVLTQPITVLDGNERLQCKVRRLPDAKCTDYVGEVTYASQAVHVLQHGEEWTLIEAYSSSVEGSSVAVWAEQFAGYVETALLKEVQVSQQYGIVIDKLQQRLYLYKEGRLYSTLLCSTGYPRKDTPYAETPAGEFVTISWTGGFWAGDLYCDMGMRINDGILLHEVPCTIQTDELGNEIRDYTKCEQYLGEKASHGCIRIQRDKTPEGISIKWLWDHLPHGKSAAPAKVLIWDEVGRRLEAPDDDYVLYYNPNNGRQVHSSPYCQLVNEKFWPLTAFAYGQLEEAPYKKLKVCPGCAPELRRSGIDTINSKNTRRLLAR